MSVNISEDHIENFLQLVDETYAEKLFQIKTQRACIRFLWDYLSENKQKKATQLLYLGYKIEYALRTKEE